MNAIFLMRPLAAALAFALFASCATAPGPSSKQIFSTAQPVTSDKEHRTYLAETERYEALATQAAPANWKVGAMWRFVARNKDGGTTVLVFRITDAPAQACLVDIDDPVGWRKLELLDGDASKVPSPAYSIRGRNLTILLSTGLCDVYPMYRGVLSDAGFAGSHQVNGMFESEQLGDVSGQPIEGIPAGGMDQPPSP